MLVSCVAFYKRQHNLYIKFSEEILLGIGAVLLFLSLVFYSSLKREMLI